MPSPCGPNSNCRATADSAICSCIPGYLGRSPNCRPECTTNSECPNTRACINEKCRDPCRGTCGNNAQCHVNKHQPICQCLDHHTGDPFTGCSPIISKI